MDPFYLKKLQIVLNDFFVAIKTITPESIEKEESRKEWINLNNSFSWQMYHKYPEHEIISEDMSARLHKYMLIICADMMTRDFTNKCRGCYWLLNFIDSELAKQKLRELKENLDERDNEVQIERRELSRNILKLEEISNELNVANLELQKTNIDLQEEKKKNQELQALLLEQNQRPDVTRRVYLQGRCWN
jgi:hypothetical protein